MRRFVAVLLAVACASVGSVVAATGVGAAESFDNAVTRYHVLQRFFDSQRLTAGQPAVFTLDAGFPAGVTGLVATVAATDYPEPGVVMATDCTRAPDPLVDGVQHMGPLHYANGGDAHQAIIPVAAGKFCLTSTTDATVGVVGSGYTDHDPTGFVYQDAADVTVYDGPMPGIEPIAVPTSGAFALWASGSLDAASADGQVTVAPCNALPDQQRIVSMGPGERFFGSAVLVAASGLTCITGKGSGHVRVELAGTYAVGGSPSALGPPLIRYGQTRAPRFSPVDPVRVLDTREAPGRPVEAGGVERLDLSGSVPPGATAVTVNITVTEPVGGGFVTAYPCDSEVPLASNVNYRAGQTVANAATVRLGDSRSLCLSSSSAAHLIVDLSGWFGFGGGDGFESSLPTRAFDTRTTGRLVAADATWEADLSSLVAPDASSVVLNVTVTQPVFAGYLSVHPCGGPRPVVSSVNFAAGATVANLVTVKLPADKRVCFYAQVPLHLIADVSGWFRPSSDVGFVDVNPGRLFDTREPGQTAVGARTSTPLTFVRDAEAWLMNVTVDQPAATGFVTAYPCDAERPVASNVNFTAGRTVPNLVVVRPAADRSVCFYSHATTHLLADLAGYFTSELFVVPFEPPGFDHG